MIQQRSGLAGVTRIKDFADKNGVVATFVFEDHSAIDPSQRVVKQRDAGLAGVAIDTVKAISDVGDHAGKALTKFCLISSQNIDAKNATCGNQIVRVNALEQADRNQGWIGTHAAK